MANSHAKAGVVAAKAGPSTGGKAAEVEAPAPAEGTGTAEIAVPEAPAPAENAPTEAAKLLETATEAIKTVVKEAEKLEKPENAQKIKFVRSHPEYAYNAGDTGELAPEHAEKLVSGGFAERVA